MLNKDLLRYNTRSGEIKPKFIKADDPALLTFAEDLLGLYDADLAPTRGEIEEMAMGLINAQKDLKLAKGINKLILDKSEFTIHSEVDHVQQRRDTFSFSNSLLNLDGEMSLQQYRGSVINELKSNQTSDMFAEEHYLCEDLYADLAVNEQLVAVKPMFPRELLERYNTSLVQSFLLYAKKLTVTFEEPDPARMRTLFRYLRFFRLLSRTKNAECNRYGVPRKVVMEIDGPMSLFENTQKYALQLACFFPAICLLKKWKIETEVKIGKKELSLKLSQRSNLTSHYRDSSYVPEEVRMFADLFAQKVPEWTILSDATFLDLGDQEMVFPDMSFQDESDCIVHLELFHRWHSHQLVGRLEYMEQNPNLPLILGVDRAIYNKKEYKALLDGSEWFQNHGFLFRDFPGVDRVKKCLNLSLENRDKPTSLL